MNEEQELAQLDAKIDEAVACIKSLRQKNEALKLANTEKDQKILEKDKKIAELNNSLKGAQERVETLLKQLPPEKGE